MDLDYTIVMPEYCYPNRMAVSLRGLVKHSTLKPKILVIYSDPRDEEGGKRAHVSDLSGEKYIRYWSVPDYIEQNRDFIDQNNIEFHDITQRVADFRSDYYRGLIGNGAVQKNGKWIYSGGGGVDSAFKNTCGLELAKTTWVVTDWDDDYYPGPDWDINTLKYVDSFIEERPGQRGIFTPTHVQTVTYDRYPGTRDKLPIQDQWEDMREYVCNLILWPVDLPNEDGGVLEEEWVTFCEKWKRVDAFVEKPGLRGRAHWSPIFYLTEDMRNHIKPYSYMGTGYDVEIDDRCGKLDYAKVTSRDAFILHKGFVRYAPEDI